MEFIDLQSQYRFLRPEIDRNIKAVLDSSQFIGGRFVDEFEELFSSYIGRKYCVTCGNGTDALQLAYMAYGIGAGDVVFCPNMTFISSVEPAAMLGAVPFFCDIDSKTYNLDPDSLETAITKVLQEGELSPKAVVVVDFLGNPADMDKIASICAKYNLILIEDAAQGIGGSYCGKKLGDFGDIATTSFFPSKPLGCYGDGGAILTDNEVVAELLRSLKVHGKGESKYNNVRIGINSRLDNIQAAVLVAKLKHLDVEIEGRQELAKRYDDSLKDWVVCPFVEENCMSAYAQYVVLLQDEAQRTDLMSHLAKQGIPSLIYYPKVLSSMAGYDMYTHVDCPNAVQYASTNLGLPFSPYMTDEDQQKVIKAITSFFGE